MGLWLWDSSLGVRTEQLELNVKYVHPIPAGEAGNKKPEKFPSPEIKLDSSAEEWDEFLVTWEQYKAEYNLLGGDETVSVKTDRRETFHPDWAVVTDPDQTAGS